MNTNIIILTFLLLIILIERKKFKREGLAFLRRSDKGVKWIHDRGKKYENLLNMLGDFAVLLSYGMLSFLPIYKERKRKTWVYFAIYVFVLWFFFEKMGLMEGTIKGIWGNNSLWNNHLMNLSRVFIYLFGIGGFSFSILILGSISIIYNHLILAKEIVSPLQIVLPIKVPKNLDLPILSVPFDKWIISIFVLVIVHEFAHALMAVSNKVKVKSIGYGFLLVLPLGFAEPDEEKLAKRPLLSRLRVYAAGSFSNFIFAIIFGILMIGTGKGIAAMHPYQFEGISYNGLVNGTYAPKVLPQTGIITHIDGIKISNFTHFANILNSHKPGENITLTINQTNYTLTLSKNPYNTSLPFIGIMHVGEKYKIKENIKHSLKYPIFLILVYLSSLFMWISLLNVGIGIANLLPLIPLDGGLIIRDILEKKRWLYILINIITLFLLIFSLVGKHIL